MTYIAKPTPRKREPKPLRSKLHVIPTRLREEVLNEWWRTCQWCFIEGGALDLHHRTARSQGGADSRANLVPLHRLCHRQVHASPSVARKLGLIVAAGAKP